MSGQTFEHLVCLFVGGPVYTNVVSTGSELTQDGGLLNPYNSWPPPSNTMVPSVPQTVLPKYSHCSSSYHHL